MTTKRSYGEACRFAHALDLVGERWALLVVRELLLGPKRFTDLRNGLPNASTNILAERLRELEEGGVVRKRKLPPPGRRVRLRADRVGPGAGADRDPARRLGRALALPARDDRRSAPTRSSSPCARSSTPRPPARRAGTYEIRLGETTSSTSSSRGGGRDRAPARRRRGARRRDRDRPRHLRRPDLRPALARRRPGGGRREIEGGKRTAARFLRLFPMPEPCAGAASEPAAVGAA